MAITNTDIVLYQAQDNTDNDNGGGSRTSNVVADGAVNNLFPDISRIDTTSGDVALRKVFPVINTDNRDIYYGAHSMLRATPSDPNVSAMIFYTGSPHDIRREAQDEIEAYVVPSYKAPFYLFGDHIKGSRAVTFLQRLEELLPDVGETYLLKYGAQEQYVRITNIDAREVTLSYLQNDYKRRRVVAEITQPLTDDFVGSQFNPDGQLPNTTDTFVTQIADAANFYGTKTLDVDANQGQTAINVDDIFEQLVPSTTQQTPLVNKDAVSQGEVLVQDSQAGELSQSVAWDANGNASIPTPVTPESLRVPSGGLTDDGNGNVLNSSLEVVGSIDYKTGSISQTERVNLNDLIYWVPATVVESRIQFTRSTPVTQENQGYVYIMNVAPVPTGSDVYVDYRSGGRSYRITGNNDGTLGIDATVGTGSVNDNGDGTATITVTLGATPDIDSTIIYSWGSDDYLINMRDEIQAVTDFFVKIDLGNKLIDSTGFTFSYTNPSGTSYSLTVDANGDIDDTPTNLIGKVDFQEGVMYLRPKTAGTASQFPDMSTGASSNNTFTIAYNYGDEPAAGQQGELNVINNPAFVADQYDIGEAIEQDSVVVRLEVLINDSNGFYVPSRELVLKSYEGFLRESPDSQVVGTVTAQGVVTLDIPTRTTKNSTYTRELGVVFVDGSTNRYRIGNINSLEYRTAALASYPNAYSQTVIAADITTVGVNTYEGIVGRVTFTMGGTDYYAVNGNVYRMDDGKQVGTLNPIAGKFEIEPAELPSVLEFSFDVIFADLSGDYLSIKELSFRTSATDLTTSSLILRYSTENGSFTATTDANGVFTGTDIDVANSYVDTRTGAVHLEFTAVIDPTSVRYDAVAETTLPLDPELLGLNPVRLPPNGKVPVFKPGYHLVIFNEQSTDIVGTPSAGQTVNLSRDKQSYIEVVDVNGARLAFDQYTADRDAGTVTFADPLNLVDRNGDAMTGPYSIVDRVEDMVLCTDAQVSGLLRISAPLQRNYLAGETKIASCLVWGDVGARYFNLFSQQTFDGWFDEPTTDPITAQYDDVNYPIQIVNKDSVAGRWMVRFKSSTTVEVIEENLGVVLANVTISTTNVAPINPATGQPYWVMDFNGFGSGWVTGNIIRFNTESGEENMWLIRTVQSGQLTEEIDSMDLEIRGDAN